MTETKFCRDCGNEIHIKAEICPKCGVRQTNPPGMNILSNGGNTSGDRFVAAMLALFLGSFGLHKFYLGRIFQGLIYLAFCWTFMPALISFIEAIYYLTMSDDDFSRKYR